MNFVNGRVERSNGEVYASFAGNRLRIDDAAIAERPGLKRYEDRPVVVGIRPDATEDAAIARDAPQDRRFSGVAELRETVGSEAFVHFTLDAEPVVTDDIRALASDTGTEMLQKLEDEASEHKTPFVARMHARSRARERERVEIAVDTREPHFFDPQTGDGIYA
jgi:multiple sugar transport system ATP-binding protein